MDQSRDARRAELRAKEETLHAAYMACPAGSQEERTLELALEEIMNELDRIFWEEELEEWAAQDRAMRERLRDLAYLNWSRA